MACGICAPEMFDSNATGRTIGYCTTRNPLAASEHSATLHHMGCQSVITEAPDGRFETRLGWRYLICLLRRGYTLMAPNMRTFGTRPASQVKHLQDLEARGINVCVLTPDAKDDLPLITSDTELGDTQ